MALNKHTVRCCVLLLFSLQLVDSQDLLPAPSLMFDSSVNQSDIKLYSHVYVLCTVPDEVRKPVEVLLSRADDPNPSSHVQSFTIWKNSPRLFSFVMRPESETSYVCWYRNTQSRTQSHYSQAINIHINALFKPIAVLYPEVFPVGMKYTFQCETPQADYINTTMSVFGRLLPIQPGTESFQHIGSRVLAPGDFGGAISRISTRETYEFVCEMEVFLNGRSLRSISNIITVRPEELPGRLVPPLSRTGSCYGDAYVRVRDDWRPFCFVSKVEGHSDVANVICRELGCGPAIDYERVSDKSTNAVGTPNCTGKETKIAECPLTSARFCDQGTLKVICSAALPPPTLSLTDRETASRVYVRTEESVELQCLYLSSAEYDAYITFTQNGKDISTKRVLNGSKAYTHLREPVTEGEYACYTHTRSSSLYRTANSNIIELYIYNPPPAGAVAGAIICTIIGVIILVLLCVCSGSK